MRSPVIQYRILTLMLFTAVVALMAALGLLLPPRDWIAFFLGAFVDIWRHMPFLVIAGALLAFAAAIAVLIELFHLARRELAHWLIDSSDSRRAIVLSRWLCGRAMTTESIAERSAQLYDSEKYEDCVALLNVAVDVDSAQAIYWHFRAACHYAMKNMQATIDDATQALLHDPSLTESRQFRACALISKKDWQAALEDLTKIQCSESGDAPYAMWRGRYHEELGHWAEAEGDYELSLRLDPENIEAMQMAARFYSGCPINQFRDGAKAIVLATKACKRSEFEDWISLSILASAYAELGDFDTALVYARRTLELAPAEEKAERAKRIEQFERRISYRLPVPVILVE